MDKIIFTGPESTGKSEMARLLAQRYRTAWVPEYARAYLEGLGRPYTEADLLEIARGQLRLEEGLAQQAEGLLFCDTGLLVIKVWSEYKYGRCHPWIVQQLRARPYRLYVLCGIDLPWAPDPLRENPGQRQELYAIYQRELQALGMPYIELWGSRDERMATMARVVEEITQSRDQG